MRAAAFGLLHHGQKLDGTTGMLLVTSTTKAATAPPHPHRWTWRPPIFALDGSDSHVRCAVVHAPTCQSPNRTADQCDAARLTTLGIRDGESQCPWSIMKHSTPWIHDTGAWH